MNSLVSDAPPNQFEASRLGILAGFSMPRGSSDACPNNLQFLADKARRRWIEPKSRRPSLRSFPQPIVSAASRPQLLQALVQVTRAADAIVDELP
jgi:hypothetical protein